MNEYAGRQVRDDVQIDVDDVGTRFHGVAGIDKEKSPEERPAKTKAGTVWQSSRCR
jgi:hypothetical protein